MSYTNTSRVALLAALALAAAPRLAAAQGRAAPTGKSFAGFAGLGVATLPRYAGSDEYRVLPLPLAQIEYKGRVYLGGSQTGVGAGLGVHLVRTRSLRWDVGFSGSESRPEKRGDALAGMGKRGAASFASTGVTYRAGLVAATAGVAVGLGDDQGTMGTAGIAGERQLSRRWIVGASTGVTVADAENMAFDFGVTPGQSGTRRALATAGDARLRGIDVRAYAPRSGLKQVQGSTTLGYAVTARTRAVLLAQGTYLGREAARSPLTRARTGVTTGVALAYGF
jgi:outer membrane scaffolding protein for murein synthesis (MipA/OmpV family)